MSLAIPVVVMFTAPTESIEVAPLASISKVEASISTTTSASPPIVIADPLNLKAIA